MFLAPDAEAHITVRATRSCDRTLMLRSCGGLLEADTRAPQWRSRYAQSVGAPRRRSCRSDLLEPDASVPQWRSRACSVGAPRGKSRARSEPRVERRNATPAPALHTSAPAVPTRAAPIRADTPACASGTLTRHGRSQTLDNTAQPHASTVTLQYDTALLAGEIRTSAPLRGAHFDLVAARCGTLLLACSVETCASLDGAQLQLVQSSGDGGDDVLLASVALPCAEQPSRVSLLVPCFAHRVASGYETRVLLPPTCVARLHGGDFSLVQLAATNVAPL